MTVYENRKIRGNYSKEKECIVKAEKGKFITIRQYNNAIKRMALMVGDYPRIADGGQEITVYDKNNFIAIIS